MTDEVQASGRSLVLGKRISEARKRLNITQMDLALRLDVTSGAISQWETDLNLPSLETSVSLAEALEVSLEWLITGGETSVQGSAQKFRKISGMRFVNNVTKALDADILKPSQIAILGALLDEFVDEAKNDR